MTNEKEHKKSKKIGKESRNFLIVSLMVAGVIIAESALLNFPDLPLWVSIGGALAHIPFTILVAVLGWRILKELDELQRLIHIQAFIIGVTGSVAILLSYGLLTSIGLVSGKLIWYFWPLLWVFYSLSFAYVSKKMS